MPTIGHETIDYLLRRAEQETVAAIRSDDERAARAHDRMAQAYSARAVAGLTEVGGQAAASRP